jgi:hypothetical protein
MEGRPVTALDERNDVETPDMAFVPYVHKDGSASEHYESDGRVVRCATCRKAGVEHPYMVGVNETTGLGGHVRMNHRDVDNLRTPEALDKMVDSRRYNKLKSDVTAALDLIAGAVDYEPSNTTEVTRLKAQLAKAEKRADEAEAKLANLRSVFKGL